MSTISLIIGREFNERVRKKSFIITTLLMPVLMIALMIAPALIMEYSRGAVKRIAVIDGSGLVAGRLASDEELSFESIDLSVEEARRLLTDHFGILVVGPNILTTTGDVKLYANSSSSLSLESNITGQIERILEAEKLKQYRIENLAQILDEVKTTVTLQTFRNDKSQEEDAQARSSVVATATGYVLGFILYMFLLLYGTMVMQSVIEEKNNRVLEIVVSSVKPSYLMLGKIVGIGLVAITQILIWALIIMSFTYWVMPSLVSGIADGGDPELMAALGVLGDGSFMLSLFVYLLLFLIGGYLFYSSIYAAIGSAVDNIQDASQLQTFAILPIIIGVVLAPSVVSDPMSSFATWASIIPFTSSMVMMARIPFDIPVWQIITSLVLLYATFLFMIWLSAKIYRVGILMYGKKPTIAELIRWARYK